MTERERVESIRNLLKFNKKTFSEVLGHTHSQNYTKYLNGSNSLSAKAMRALIEYDNRFNLNWILTGDGQMFLGDDQKIINGDGNILQTGHNNEFSGNSNNISNNSNDKEIELLKNKIEFLEKALEEKDERLKDKEELITLLKKNQK